MAVGDPVWRMPFWDPYEPLIEPGIADLDKLPSLQWKLQNIGKMTDKKRETALVALKKALSG